jgi:hypothetical protein
MLFFKKSILNIFLIGLFSVSNKIGYFLQGGMLCFSQKLSFDTKFKAFWVMWPIDMATLESLFLKFDHILQSFLRDSTNAISFYHNWAVLAHNRYVDKTI